MTKLVQFKIANDTMIKFDSMLKNRTRSQALRDMIEKFIEKGGKLK